MVFDETDMVVGTVLRSHAGGYLVYEHGQDAVFSCAARGRLKKEKVSIVTGDRVELDEIQTDSGTAVICTRLERQNILSRPFLANVDQVIIVQAIHQPDWSPLICDRYLVHFKLELQAVPPILCFNKCDLASPDDIAALRSIYEPLGYFVTIVSAKAGIGMEELSRLLSGKVSVLAGPSGVGKSSILNYLEPSLHLKVGVMENEFGVGRHTTTYSELYRIGIQTHAEPSWVADTPGFNLTEFRYPEPALVMWQFPELVELAQECRFLDCLHNVEDSGCNVIANIDKVSPSRYASYLTIVTDSLDEQRLRKDTSKKVESNVKVVGGHQGKGRHVPKLSGKYRAASRRRERQKLSDVAELEPEMDDSDESNLDESDLT